MMSAAKNITLPKLPHGEGTMSYDEKGNIVYKKWIQLSDGSKYRKTIKASTLPECFRLMMKEEETALQMKPIEYNAPKFEQEIMYWLNNIKKSTLKVQSWQRLESTIRNIIIPSPIGNKRINAITSKDIQSFINSIGRMQGDEFCVMIHMDIVIMDLQRDCPAYVFRWCGIRLPAIAEEAGPVHRGLMIDQLIRASYRFLWQGI